MSDIKVGTSWVSRRNPNYLVEIVGINGYVIDFMSLKNNNVTSYYSGFKNWREFMKRIDTKQEHEFIIRTEELKTGRFGNLHITDHNDLVKVSVVQMTNAEQVRTVINQLTAIAEFWEG